MWVLLVSLFLVNSELFLLWVCCLARYRVQVERVLAGMGTSLDAPFVLLATWGLPIKDYLMTTEHGLELFSLVDRGTTTTFGVQYDGLACKLVATVWFVHSHSGCLLLNDDTLSISGRHAFFAHYLACLISLRSILG